jgi:hypothetical protein
LIYHSRLLQSLLEDLPLREPLYLDGCSSQEDELESVVAGRPAAAAAAAAAAVVVVVVVVVAFCLGFAGTLQPRAVWRPQRNLVSVYKSRKTKNLWTDRAFPSECPDRKTWPRKSKIFAPEQCSSLDASLRFHSLPSAVAVVNAALLLPLLLPQETAFNQKGAPWPES